VGKERLRAIWFCSELVACVLRGSIFFFLYKVERSYKLTKAEQGETIYKIACDPFREGQFTFLSM